jgi:amidase
MRVWLSDGGQDVNQAFGLSGEEPIPQLAILGADSSTQATAFEVAATFVAKRELQKIYMEYWNSTADLTSTGRPVDAILAPAMPFAAARPNKFVFYGYTVAINALDYTAAVLPVTKVDKTIDVIDKTFTPKTEADKINYEACKKLY